MSPIRSSEKSRYPKDWKAIAARIKERAEGRCECVTECRLHTWGRCVERAGRKAFFAKGNIVLSVAHLDRVPANCAEDNLKAMCARCHLRYDVPQHVENARKTREAKSPQFRLPI